jgi:hypothetical protein
MSSLNVFTNGFWNGFNEKIDGVHFGFFEKILSESFCCDIILTHNIQEADLLLESHFGPSKINIKKWKYSIFFSGEGHGFPMPDTTLYTIILGSKSSKDNYVPCPLYLAYEFCKPYTYPTNIKTVPPKGVCAIISNGNNTDKKRIEIISNLQKSGIRVDMAGRFNNNVGFTVPGQYYESPIIEFQKQYRLVLAFENTKMDEYITEKIVNPLRAGTIPVYYGSNKIGDHFNKSRIVLSDDIDSIKRLLVDDEYYLSVVNNDIWVNQDHMNNIINKMKLIISNNFIL